MDLVDQVYRSTKAFPREEIFGLTSQLRRAVVSVPSNIAEGQGRNSTQQFLHHLSIAYGSLMETETQILIAHRQQYLSQTQTQLLLEQAAEVGRMLNGLSAALSKRPTGH
ncbi:MAG: four helix bundle protein [Methylococcus sp.]